MLEDSIGTRLPTEFEEQVKPGMSINTSNFREGFTHSALSDLQRALDRYRLKLISLGRAAEMAGLPYDKFIDELERKGIPLHFGPESPEEAEREARQFDEAIKRSQRQMRSP